MSRIAFLALSVILCQVSAAFPQRQAKDADGLPLPAGAVARLGTLRGVDAEAIGFLALSADGKKVATVPEWPNNPTLRIREVPSGKLLEVIPLKIKFWENMAISSDFQTLAWTYLDNTVAIVDLATRKQTILNPPTKDARGVAVAFSSDGKKIVVTFKHHYSYLAPPSKGGDKQWVSECDFEIVEWTLGDRKKRQLWKDDEKVYPYRQVALAPDAKSLAYIKKTTTKDVADFAQEFVLENAAPGKVRLRLPLRDGVDYLMEFNPDGTALALADDESLKVIDLAQDKVRWTTSYKGEILRPKPRWSSTRDPWPEKLVWPYGGNVGVFFEPGELWTWRLADGTPAKRYASPATRPLAFATDAPVLAFTQDGGSLQFLDTLKGKALSAVNGHRQPPGVLFRSDGSLISHDENKICLWTGDWQLRTSLEFHDKGQRYYFGPSQDFFVRTVGKKVEARNLKNGDVLKEWTLQSAADFVALLPDGKTLAAGYLYKSEEPEFKVAERSCVRLLDVASGAQKDLPLPYQPWDMKASPTQAIVAFKYRDDWREYLDVLDVATGKLRRLMDDKTVYFSLLDFAPDGKKLHLSAEPVEGPDVLPREVTLAAVELTSGKVTKQGKVDRIHEAAFSADGRLLLFSPRKRVFEVVGKYGRAYTTPSNEIIVRELASELVRARFNRANAWIKSVSCSPHINYFATGLYDSTILVWDVRQIAAKR
jgi:WD40 repeat protein